MKKFHLDIYKETRQYLYLFDVLMKDEIINKDYFLADLGINPGSYRRAKVTEQKIGKEIVEILSRKFNIPLVSSDEVDQLESLTNRIYYNVNYKNYDHYDEFMELVDKKLKYKNLLFPIYLLLKLLLITNTQKDVTSEKNKNRDLYEQILKFKKFYINDLLEIYDLLVLSFSKNLSNELISKKHNNGLAYTRISLHYYSKKSYYESLYFALKAKNIFLLENNYKRMIYINLTILNNLSFTLDFEEYYKLANEQLHTLRSLNLKEGFEITTTTKHVAISCIALEKYQEVIELLEAVSEMTITEIFCLIIAKYKSCKNEFNNWYNEIYKNIDADDKYFKLLDDLIVYLNDPDSKNLQKLKDYSLMPSLINVLKCS